ncbi:hypothetical protein KUCAC02_018456 [Chaenocephalus aceratus]|uniref:Uncharacterized protein n=1 Tax=Chaenocephalus aceratus TaxID=36190 RepID=A0ACB9WA27_CHAAC|nr:hypothetical protein KUCAC02_018456 [Chaenocephalus aceratus]
MAEMVAAVLRNNRANIQRRRARLQRLAVGLQGERINTYANLNHHVPVVQIYMDQSKDLRFDYRLSRESIEALMTLLRREKTHGWVLHVERAASRASSFSACFFRKANTLLLHLGLFVGGWELVEGTGSSSLLRDTWAGPSPAEEASAAEVDASAAEVDASAAEVDASAAEVDASAAEVEASAAEVEASAAEVEASAAVRPWLDNGHEATRVGGWIDGLPPIASCIASNHGQVAAEASPPSVPVPVGGFFNSY